MAVLFVAVLQLCSLSQVFMPARARISHGSWQICKCTPLTLRTAQHTAQLAQLVCLKQKCSRCFLDPQPTPGLELCAGFRFGYFGSPKLFTHDLWVFQCNLLLHRGLVGLGTHHYMCLSLNLDQNLNLKLTGTTNFYVGLAMLISLSLESSQATCLHLHEMSSQRRHVSTLRTRLLLLSKDSGHCTKYIRCLFSVDMFRYIIYI